MSGSVMVLPPQIVKQLQQLVSEINLTRTASLIKCSPSWLHWLLKEPKRTVRYSTGESVIAILNTLDHTVANTVNTVTTPRNRTPLSKGLINGLIAYMQENFLTYGEISDALNALVPKTEARKYTAKYIKKILKGEANIPNCRADDVALFLRDKIKVTVAVDAVTDIEDVVEDVVETVESPCDLNTLLKEIQALRQDINELKGIWI